MVFWTTDRYKNILTHHSLKLEGGPHTAPLVALDDEEFKVLCLDQAEDEDLVTLSYNDVERLVQWWRKNHAS